MNKTSIPWCDRSWNPIKGCSPVSEGCQNCYARKMAQRFHKPWGAPVFHPAVVEEVRSMVSRRWYDRHGRQRIFVCSVSDLGHPGIRPEDRCAVLDMVSSFSCFHTFILLTKRPEVLVPALWDWKRSHHMCGLWQHLWVGVTAENQARADERIPYLESLDWCRRFVSVEPMLGPVRDLPLWLDWVIAGPETGAGARPCDPGWIEALSDESPCFFDKRDPGWWSWRREWPDGPRLAMKGDPE